MTETLRPVGDTGDAGWTVVPDGPVWSAIDDDPDAPDLGDYAQHATIYGMTLNLVVEAPSALPDSATLRIYADRLTHGARLLEVRLTASGGGEWASAYYPTEQIVTEGLYEFPLWITPGTYDFSAPSHLQLTFVRWSETVGGTDVRIYALEIMAELSGGGTGGALDAKAAFVLSLCGFP